jgi:DNA-directed RNA polymerase subunit E'/Rpb7
MDNSDIFMRILLNEKIKLEPRFLLNNFREELINRLKDKIEGKCTRHGYIRLDSIEVYKITPGMIELISLNGHIQYDIYFHADVCNPMLGSIIKAKVMKINKFGILAEAGYNDPNTNEFLNILEIIIAKNSVNIISDIDLEKVNIGDSIRVEIMGKKYELNSKHISIIGKIVSEVKHKNVLKNQDNDLDIDDEDVDELIEEVDDEEEDEDEDELDELDDEDEEVVEVDVDIDDEIDEDTDVKKKGGGDLFDSDNDDLFEEEEEYDMYNDENEELADENYEDI